MPFQILARAVPTVPAVPAPTGIRGAIAMSDRTLARPGGRPRATFDRSRVLELRTKGRSWREIARELRLSEGTVRRAFQEQIGSPRAAKTP